MGFKLGDGIRFNTRYKIAQENGRKIAIEKGVTGVVKVIENGGYVVRIASKEKQKSDQANNTVIVFTGDGLLMPIHRHSSIGLCRRIIADEHHSCACKKTKDDWFLFRVEIVNTAS